MVLRLQQHGCNMLAEFDIPKNSDAIAESTSLDIWERMRTGRFKVQKHLDPWLEEYKTFYRQDSRVPRDTHPLMSATRHAVGNISRAKSKAQHDSVHKQIKYPVQSIA
jgi:hypothetical protein